MTIPAQLNALLARLGADQHPDLRDVEIAPGRFDVTELTRTSLKPPALRICFVGAARSRALPNEQRAFDAAFSIFVVTEHRTRAMLGIELSQWVAERITLWHSGVGGTGIPADLRIDALYSAEIDRRGVALHAVSWVQPVRLGQDEIGAGVHDPAALPDPDVEPVLQIDEGGDG